MGRNKDKFKNIEAQKEARRKDRETKKGLRKKMRSGDGFKLSQQYIRYYKEFNQQISRLRIKLRDVCGDGNCLFRAIADQVDGNEASHFIMREQACKFIIKNHQFFTNFLDEDQDGTIEQYIHAMRKNGQYGGHLELQALCQCFRFVIVVHTKNLQEYYITPIINESMGDIIHLAYFQNEDFEHYLSIRQIDDNSDSPASQQLKALNRNMYKHLILAAEDPQEMVIMKQIQQLEFNEEAEVPIQPYPKYPRNKKCKCGSKQAYKNCCFKEYQRQLAKKEQIMLY